MSESIQEEKKVLRTKTLERRLALTQEEVQIKSQAIQQRVLQAPFWKKATKLGLYWPIRQEVDTKLLFMKGLEQAKSIYFPRVEQGLRFYEVRDPGELQKGAWGLMEPKHGQPALSEIRDLDLLILPGLVFDKLGFRLGYGKGFYDVLLDKYPQKTLGFAYDFQVVEALPTEVWDQRVGYIVTETNLIKIDR